MSKNKEECPKENKTLKVICELEKRYCDNFEKQAELLKVIANKAMKESKKVEGIADESFNDPFTFILDFLGRGNASRKSIAKMIIGDDKWTKKEYDQVLFLGIQNLTRVKKSHLKKDVPQKDCEENIHECLKKIFLEGNSLRKEIDIKELKKLFTKPTSTVTSVLYWLYPEEYIPFDENSKELYKKLELKAENDEVINIEDTWDIYNKIRKALKKELGENDKFKPSMIIALSLAAWQFRNGVDNILNKYIGDKNKAKNIILTGIPGTGKTYSVMEFLKSNEDYKYAFVQFHPSYDYEDFIEGFKPVPSASNQVEFELVNGIFKNLCKRAYENKDKTYVMVIDEINRANLSRVFGELLYCLEYRDEFVSTKMTTYIQSLKEKDQEGWKRFTISEKEEDIGKFVIPSNVIILGTMNEVDRSIDAFDLALRRRFIWEEVGFDETVLRIYTPFFEKGFQVNIEDLIKKANKLNSELSKDIGKNYTLGHTYYFNIINYFDGDYFAALCDLWDYHLKSIVREYCKIKFGANELEDKLEAYRKIIADDKNRDG